MTRVPLASLARNSSTLDTVRLYTATVNPWSFMFRTRFWPMTARPISPMSAVLMVRSFPVRYPKPKKPSNRQAAPETQDSHKKHKRNKTGVFRLRALS